MCRNYGKNAQTALQVALRSKWCTQDSLTEFINSGLPTEQHITRATVANWSSGRENMPADVVLLLAEHCDPHRAEVLDVFVSGAGLRVVAPRARDGSAEGHAHRMISVFLDFQRVHMEATAPDSPGGPRYTPEEARKLRPFLPALIAEAEAVDAALPEDEQLKLFARGPRAVA